MLLPRLASPCVAIALGLAGCVGAAGNDADPPGGAGGKADLPTDVVPLDAAECEGLAHELFFGDLTHAPELDEMLASLGEDPTTAYQFELVGDVFVRPPSFAGGHDEEYVFLSLDDKGMSISRFALLSDILILLAQHPAQVDELEQTVFYRPLAGEQPQWVCQY